MMVWIIIGLFGLLLISFTGTCVVFVAGASLEIKDIFFGISVCLSLLLICAGVIHGSTEES